MRKKTLLFFVTTLLLTSIASVGNTVGDSYMFAEVNRKIRALTQEAQMLAQQMSSDADELNQEETKLLQDYILHNKKMDRYIAKANFMNDDDKKDNEVKKALVKEHSELEKELAELGKRTKRFEHKKLDLKQKKMDFDSRMDKIAQERIVLVLEKELALKNIRENMEIIRKQISGQICD